MHPTKPTASIHRNDLGPVRLPTHSSIFGLIRHHIITGVGNGGAVRLELDFATISGCDILLAQPPNLTSLLVLT